MTPSLLHNSMRTQDWQYNARLSNGSDSCKQELPPIRSAIPSNRLLFVGPGMALFDVKRALLGEPDLDTLVHYITARSDFIPFGYHSRSRYSEQQGKDFEYSDWRRQKSLLSKQLEAITVTVTGRKFESIGFCKDIEDYKHFWPEFFGKENFLDDSQISIPKAVIWFHPEFWSNDDAGYEAYIKQHLVYRAINHWGLLCSYQEPWTTRTTKQSRVQPIIKESGTNHYIEKGQMSE